MHVISKHLQRCFIEFHRVYALKDILSTRHCNETMSISFWDNVSYTKHTKLFFLMTHYGSPTHQAPPRHQRCAQVLIPGVGEA